MIVNLTPHVITIHGADGGTITLPPSGTVARVAVTDALVGEVDGVPVYRPTYGQVRGLPDPAPGVYYVVSALVAQAVARPDVLYPGELVRDQNGQPIGCKGLRSVAE